MAGALVELVADHLANVIKEEAELLGGVSLEVKEFERSLRSIGALLEDAENMQGSQKSVKELLKQVRDVAYDIENVVDEFLLRLGPKQIPRPGLAGYPWRFASFARQLRARHQIGNEVKRIKSLLHRIEERKNMFSLPLVISGATSSNVSYDTRRLNQPLFIEDSEMVGIEKPKHEVMEKLLKENASLRVISVFGMGGLGKTTLVRKVYENEIVQKTFNCFAWVTVSQTFSSIALFKKMYSCFIGGMEVDHSREEVERMDIPQLVQRLKDYMRKRRYLVVLDDVWTKSAWDDLRYVFPENELQSRIILTTRRHDVALYCSMSEEKVHKMEPLPKKEAWTLLCKKTFRGTCPPELEITSTKILKVCQGLPLAIMAMGGLLLTKTPSLAEWNRVLENLTMTLEKNETSKFIDQVLWLSYGDLPYHLKHCFLYFGSYPEDYKIWGHALTQQWMAEGFVNTANNEDHKELADEYLHELVDRSLVEVVGSVYDASVGYYKVHDLMHRLILQKMREENFINLATDTTNSSDEVRRLSVSSSNIDLRVKDFSRLRTLRMRNATNIPLLSSFRMLRVLDLVGAQIGVFPREIVKLYHLTYLDLSCTSIDMIPKSIKNLEKLQTLHLNQTNVTELPGEIIHLYAIRSLVNITYPHGISIPGKLSTIKSLHELHPQSIRHLMIFTKSSLNGMRMPTRLGTLQCLRDLGILQMDGGTEQAMELGKLTELRRLWITAVQEKDWDVICNSLNKMRHLKLLRIMTNLNEEKPLNIDLVTTLAPTLFSIEFMGRLKMLPELTGPFLGLVHLGLGRSGLSEDPFKALEHLPMLRTLSLMLNAFNGEEMSCGEDGYLRLKKLVLCALDQLRHVHIRKGAMPQLTEMEIESCCSLDEVPFGVENLKALSKLSFSDMASEFIEKVRNKEGEEHARVKHIPIVQHIIEDGDKSEVEYLS